MDQEKYIKIKRQLDFYLAAIAFICLFPLLLIIAIAVKAESKGPVLFRQKRVGIHKTHFQILKFRTMRMDTPKNMPTHLLEDPDVFITKVGRFLRKTSLDELPQLINILKGDMSFIGPRPALWNQYDLIKERDRHQANSILPGLTGWAQINGRDELDSITKAKLDGIYAKNISLRFDLKCLFGTFVAVARHDGIVEGQRKSH